MKLRTLIMILLGLESLQSCKNFLEIDPPQSSLVQETVFKNNDQATSAVTGIYSTMSSSSNYAGALFSVSLLTGLSSDEMVGYSTDNIPFYENQLSPGLLSSLPTLYSGPYKTIYTANSALEGLSTSSNVTPSVKAQLEGEAYFIRAFAYFYLVNLYGPVPLQLSTDYRINEVASRAEVSQIYMQIVTDLKMAESLLPDIYITGKRVRPNKSAAQSLLARVYLYLQDWKNAEEYSSVVIAKTTTYSLVNIQDVFLANSQEAIWQLMPEPNTNTPEGATFILLSTPTVASLSDNFIFSAFEPNDMRKSSWIRSYSDNTGTYYYPFKYKIKNSTSVSEYSMVLRLAEQYLIRAEARINLGKIELGVADLNLLRDRARPLPTVSLPNPLPAISPTLTKTEALIFVEKERRVELFSEWGHRWLDLKRTGRADAILGSIKSKWQSTDVLYPIPQDEINRNSNVSQNPGY